MLIHVFKGNGSQVVGRSFRRIGVRGYAEAFLRFGLAGRQDP